MAGALKVEEASTWTQEDSTAFPGAIFANLGMYMAHSTAHTRVVIARVRRGGDLIGMAPLIILPRFRIVRLLRPELRRWLDPILGPFARRTFCLVNTMLLGYAHRAPFFARDPRDVAAVRETVVSWLISRGDIDMLHITEPAAHPGQMRSLGFRSYLSLPSVHVDVDGCRSYDDYLARLSANRRRNIRRDGDPFQRAGGRLELHAPPITPELADRLHTLLLASARRNPGLVVPFQDVLNGREAFLAQEQWVITAMAGDRLAGFFSFLQAGDTLHQLHGGLDYDLTRTLHAYPNLMHAATRQAIEMGCRRLTLGVLNNDTKRRVGELSPNMSSIWFRKPLDMTVARKMMRRFQDYTGPLSGQVGSVPATAPAATPG